MTALSIVTLGCRLNAFESEVMRNHAAAAGLEDAVIVNTCAVTAEAVRQAAQTIRKLRRDRPTVRIIVTGCAAQVDPDRFAAMPEVDHIVGNAGKMRPETFRAFASAAAERVQIDDIMSVTETSHHLLDGFRTRTRAYVQVQNGCDHRCTFCIIPYGRGPSRSVPAGEVVAQIRHMVAGGTKEIVLTGVDITGYGRDLPGEATLGTLVRQILKHVPELPRLRLSSIDQVEVDPCLLAAIADEGRLMPHLHLSLQAGDDLILKRMRRRHDRGSAIAFCDAVRRRRPDVTFGADLIAGFPTESEAMFDQTLRLVEDCQLAYLHVFPFSPREGTPAARMPQVAAALIKQRAARLRAEGEAAWARHLAGKLGQTPEILMERPNIGRMADFTEVRLMSPASVGDFALARVTGHDGRRLLAKVLA